METLLAGKETGKQYVQKTGGHFADNKHNEMPRVATSLPFSWSG